VQPGLEAIAVKVMASKIPSSKKKPIVVVKKEPSDDTEQSVGAKAGGMLLMPSSSLPCMLRILARRWQWTVDLHL